MKKIILICLTIFYTQTVFGKLKEYAIVTCQNFKGKITYEVRLLKGPTDSPKFDILIGKVFLRILLKRR